MKDNERVQVLKHSIKRNTNNHNRNYFYASDGNLYVNRASTEAPCYFRINQLEDGCYTIQRNYNYAENEYIGCRGENQRIYANDTLNIKWRLIPSDNVEAVRMMLYLALEKIDSTYCVEPYDKILTSATTQDELYKAIKEVESLKSFTDSYSRMSWSDYNISFTNDANYTWSFESQYNQ